MCEDIVTTPSFPINVRAFEVVEAIRNGNVPREQLIILAIQRIQMMRAFGEARGRGTLFRRVRKQDEILTPIKGRSSHTTRARIIHLNAKLPLWDERPVKPDRRPIDLVPEAFDPSQASQPLPHIGDVRALETM